MKKIASKLVVLSASCLVLLSGCGGGGGSGSTTATGKSTVSTGTVTGFGSVFVNGVEYKTAGSKVHRPDISTTAVTLGSSETEIQSHLRIGMQVRVKGSSNGSSGQASDIEFKNNMEGLVTAKTATTLTVMGITVTVDSSTKLYTNSDAATTLASITPGTTWVEISGVPDNAGVFNATYIKEKGSVSSEQEFKGYIVASSAGSFDMGLAAGIKSVTIPAALPAGIAVGSYVEVKFNADGTFIKVEIVDDQVKADTDTTNAEAEGYISAINGNDLTISVNGRPKTVKLAASTTYYFKSRATEVLTPAAITDLTVGQKVSAEGSVSAGVITAAKVKIRTN